MKHAAVTIAVLPFEVLSDEKSDAMLAPGFTHDLLAELATFPQLGVIAADSVLAVAEGQLPPLAEWGSNQCATAGRGRTPYLGRPL